MQNSTDGRPAMGATPAAHNDNSPWGTRAESRRLLLAGDALVSAEVGTEAEFYIVGSIVQHARVRIEPDAFYHEGAAACYWSLSHLQQHGYLYRPVDDSQFAVEFANRMNIRQTADAMLQADIWTLSTCPVEFLSLCVKTATRPEFVDYYASVVREAAEQRFFLDCIESAGKVAQRGDIAKARRLLQAVAG